MWIFYNNDSNIAAYPLTAIQTVFMSGSKIEIVLPNQEKIAIAYENHEQALDKMREFYTACMNNKGAFFF